MLTYKGEEFGVKHKFEEFLQYIYRNDMKAFLADRKDLARAQRMKVLLAGRVTVPKLVCTREMHLKDLNVSVLPLAVKKGMQ